MSLEEDKGTIAKRQCLKETVTVLETRTKGEHVHAPVRTQLTVHNNGPCH
jgi:hypothetical protein